MLQLGKQKTPIIFCTRDDDCPFAVKYKRGEITREIHNHIKEDHVLLFRDVGIDNGGPRIERWDWLETFLKYKATFLYW